MTHRSHNYTGHATISRTDIRPIIQRIAFVFKDGSGYFLDLVLEMLEQPKKKEDLFVQYMLSSSYVCILQTEMVVMSVLNAELIVEMPRKYSTVSSSVSIF